MEQYYDYNHMMKAKNKLFAPLYGVELGDGLFKEVFDNNRVFITRLEMDRMRYWFDQKAGRPTEAIPYQGHFEDNLKGQTAYQTLMGAGNALRFVEDETLRKMVDEIVDFIADGAQENGFCMPVREEDFAYKEYPHYVRIWLTYGLVAAWRSGNEKAKELLRNWQDWFNQCKDLPIIKYLELAFQGIVASPAVYMTPIGKPEDMEITREYYEETWRLAQFMRMEADAVSFRFQPGKEPHAHGTELEAMEGYLDLYRYSGVNYLLHAALGAWELYYRDWRHLGSGIVMCEFLEETKPGCNVLDNSNPYNELCCTSFWMGVNQRLHFLFPDEEKYVLELEQSLYNIAFANQDGDERIRYFAYLHKNKDAGFHGGLNHCCCGVGTRIFGSLPEYLYSVSDEEVSIDIFAKSKLHWQHGAETVTIAMDTEFPYDNRVTLCIGIKDAAKYATHQFRLKIRVPSYVKDMMKVLVNGEIVAVGEPGTYVILSRNWKDEDTVVFEVPMGLTRTLYQGVAEVDGYERYGYMYGPVLMAVRGMFNHEEGILLPDSCQDLTALNREANEKDLIFDIPGSEYQLIPYFDIGGEEFSCFPLTLRP